MAAIRLRARPVFQFTLPCRERPHTTPSRPPRRSFNSRSRVGSDLAWADVRFDDKVSRFQFTLPCRERPLWMVGLPITSCFNSRSRVGSDRRVADGGLSPLRFQFTLPCRERHNILAIVQTVVKFQFTLPCRERPTSATVSLVTAAFQFTLPCRERLGAFRAGRGLRVVSIHAPV